MPQEKAIELVNKYLQVYDGRVDIAKRCALIAIDEIIKTFVPKNKPNYISSEIEYWQDVKKEIEKL